MLENSTEKAILYKVLVELTSLRLIDVLGNLLIMA